MSQVRVPYSCSACEKPLIEIDCGKYYRIVCDNGQCHLYREKQGIREKNPGFTSMAETLPSVVPPPKNAHSPKKKRGKKGRIKSCPGHRKN
jgi:hypothetical protein